jgi:hypothetical protein
VRRWTGTRLVWVSGFEVRRNGWRFKFADRKVPRCNSDAWAVDKRRLKREKRRAKARRFRGYIGYDFICVRPEAVMQVAEYTWSQGPVEIEVRDDAVDASRFA